MSGYTPRTCNGCHEKFSKLDSFKAFPRKRRAYHPRCMPGGDITCRLCKGSGEVCIGSHGDLWRDGFSISSWRRCGGCAGMGMRGAA